MSNNYKVDSKAVVFEVRANDFTLARSDYLKWLKIDTNTQDITVTLPASTTVDFFKEGWNCTLENIGTGTIFIVPGTGASFVAPAATVDDQYRSAQVIYDSGNTWRGQGYLGPNDLTSLTGVTANAPFPSDYNALAYDGNTNQWIPRNFPRFLETSTITGTHNLADSDHRRLYLVDTSGGPVTINQNLGLQHGLDVDFVNIGTGVVTLTAAGNVTSEGGASAFSLSGMWSRGKIYHQSVENYFLLGDWTV